jgi:hypothetical protein
VVPAPSFTLSLQQTWVVRRDALVGFKPELKQSAILRLGLGLGLVATAKFSHLLLPLRGGTLAFFGRFASINLLPRTRHYSPDFHESFGGSLQGSMNPKAARSGWRNYRRLAAQSGKLDWWRWCRV